MPRVAVVGRPNVGKSTLINLLLGQERLVANPKPGTTRDSIDAVVQTTARNTCLSIRPVYGDVRGSWT